MIQSMTGFASAKGSFQAFSWTWELRSVNGKGLDLRLRVPEWIDGLEAALRARLGKALTRGNVTLSLRLLRDEEAGTLALNEGQLASVLTAMARVEAEAMDRGLSLAPANATDILALRGVLETAAPNDDVAPLAAALIKDFEPLLQAFLEMRRSEGTALSRVMAAQLDDIERLTASAATAAEARKGEMADNLRTALARVLDNIDGADPQRVAQELAMIAVKSDVTEEIDRLTAHVAAARELLTNGAPMGRKLDFLAQEFNREANTLCSKAQSKDLTRIGLDLKAVIDQMREQVQNVE